MINYRVANLKKVIAALKAEKVWIDPKGIEKSEYGQFAWIKDGEGNRIELWQPPIARNARGSQNYELGIKKRLLRGKRAELRPVDRFLFNS